MADAIARLSKEVESYRDTGLVDDEFGETFDESTAAGVDDIAEDGPLF
jgi:hypothetical protein